MTPVEKLELELRRITGELRHLYENMVGGWVHGQEGIDSIADGILSPCIARLERLADRMIEHNPLEFTPE